MINIVVQKFEFHFKIFRSVIYFTFRFMVCSHCKIVWNRDVNAGRNILYKGLRAVMGEDIDEQFHQSDDEDEPNQWYSAFARANA